MQINLLPTTVTLFTNHEVWAKRAGIDVRVPMSQILSLFQINGMAFSADSSFVNLTVSGLLKVGATALSSDAKAGILINGNGLEFGHTNALYRGMLGSDVGGGTPFQAFQLEAGTTVNTYRTRGTRGVMTRSDNNGGWAIANVALANADNQAPVTLFAINNAGGITTPLTTTAAFTSIGLDDNCTSERMEIQDGTLVLGPTGAGAGYNISRVTNDQYLDIAGGTAGLGGNILLVGGTHASLANDIGFMRGPTNVYYWDDSAQTHSFNNATGVNKVQIADAIMTTAVGYEIHMGSGSSSTPGSGNNLSGTTITGNGVIFSSVNGQSLILNQVGGSGNIQGFNLSGTNQGFISGSGATITYGAFMGSHIGQMYGSAANIELLRGSIVKTVDVMSEWFGFTYTDHDDVEHTNEAVPAGLKVGDKFDFTYDREVIEEIKHVDEVSEVETEEIDEPFTDYEIVDGSAVAVIRKRKKRLPIYDEFNVVDKKGKPVTRMVPVFDVDGNPIVDVTPVLNKRKKPIFDEIDGQKVLRVVETPRLEEKQKTVRVPRRIMVKQERVEHVKTIVPETVKATVVLLENDTLVKWELTAEAGCERPYGVIAWHDFDESDDWLISGLGAYVCRIKAGVKVKGGDLIQSSDVAGCGEPITEKMNLSALQIAKRHVATVGANIPQAIYRGGPLFYPDKSYIVPATIHCG